MKKTFFKELLHRRVLQIIGSYFIASISLVGALDWMVARYALSETYVTLAIFCLISIMPSVVILAYFHGAPGKDEWTKIEKYGIPINVIFIALAIFIGKIFETDSADTVSNTFYYSFNSNQDYVNYLVDRNTDERIDKIEVVSNDLLEEIFNEVPPAINASLVHKNINVFTPKNKKDRMEFDFLPIPHVFKYIQDKNTTLDMASQMKIDLNNLDKKMDKKHKVNIDGYIVISLARIHIHDPEIYSATENQGWALMRSLGYWVYTHDNKLYRHYFDDGFMDFENNPDDVDIKESLVELISDFVLEKKYGDTEIGKVDEILDENLVSVRIENENIAVLKGNKLEQVRYYTYSSENLDNFDFMAEKEIDDLKREKDYVNSNPEYILNTHCESCAYWDLDDSREHDPKDLKYMLESYLEATNARIDSLIEYRDILKEPYSNALKNDDYIWYSYGVDKHFILDIVKVTETHIIAKIVKKNADYIIPKVGDRVWLIID